MSLAREPPRSLPSCALYNIAFFDTRVRNKLSITLPAVFSSIDMRCKQIFEGSRTAFRGSGQVSVGRFIARIGCSGMHYTTVNTDAIQLGCLSILRDR